MVFELDIKTARRLLMQRQGLCDPPHLGQDAQGLLQMIHKIGFVQVDSINTVERAHHMILFARNQTYRPKHLQQLLEKDRQLFENWTHDASIIPSAFYPYWRHQFEHMEGVLRERWRKWRRHGFEQALEEVLHHVATQGPTRSRDLTALDQRPKSARSGGSGWWDWHPSKTALEYLWRTGQIAICRRENFQKVYNLCHEVIPQPHLTASVDRSEMVDWACREALHRLGIATSGELAAFWDLVSVKEAKDWCEHLLGTDLMEVEIRSKSETKPRRAFAAMDLPDQLSNLSEPPKRLRVLSPFDPVLRDRKRALRLFGFDYRIEIFVPAAKRVYGYYVFPLLRGDRFIGRIDMKHDRADQTLHINGLWFEPGVKRSKALLADLQAELERMRRFTQADRIAYNISADLMRPR